MMLKHIICQRVESHLLLILQKREREFKTLSVWHGPPPLRACVQSVPYHPPLPNLKPGTWEAALAPQSPGMK